MGFFDSIAGQLSGALAGAGGGQGGLMQIVGDLINNPQTGGLPGLVHAFEAQGLGGVVGSWIGTGHNLPITPEQLQSVLGSEQVQAIAQKMGLSTDEVASHLAALLPHAVDHVTPDGTVPPAGAIDDALGMLKGWVK